MTAVPAFTDEMRAAVKKRIGVPAVDQLDIWLEAAFGDVLAIAERDRHYLSSGCFHGKHEYCKNSEGQAGPKAPARCKWCPAVCRCTTCNHPKPAVDVDGRLREISRTTDPGLRARLHAELEHDLDAASAEGEPQ